MKKEIVKGIGMNQKKDKVKYVRSVIPDLIDVLDGFLERRQAMHVLGIKEEPKSDIAIAPMETKMSIPSNSQQSKEDGSRIKRLSEELEKRDEVVKEMTMELNQLRDANQAWQRDNAKLKAERKAEENPGLAASENIVLRKKIKEITAGVMKEGAKMEGMEKLMEMMEGWELPVFESWQVAMRTKRMNGKQEKATMDQECSDVRGERSERRTAGEEISA